MKNRLIYEGLMLKAFGISSRFDRRIANADFYDSALANNLERVSTAIVCALYVIYNIESQHKEWINEAIFKLESNLNSIKTIDEVLSNLPIEYYS